MWGVASQLIQGTCTLSITREAVQFGEADGEPFSDRHGDLG
jgi:hypothetical protein